MFGVRESVVSRRYKCLQITKNPSEDHVAYACKVNKSCVEFELSKLSEDQFKCLIYVCGLKSECDVEIRTRLLSKIEEKDDVTLQQLSEECQRLLNLKHDSAMIENQSSFDQVHAIKQKPVKHREDTPSEPDSHDSQSKPSSPCWFCGALHYVRDCTFRNHKCSECGQFGHREGYCETARRSKKSKRRGRKHSMASNVVTVNSCNIQYRQFVPVQLHGKSMQLQLDTASDISIISKQIWQQVGSPKLIHPTVSIKTASGHNMQLIGEFTCDVTVGEVTHKTIIRVAENQVQLFGTDLIDIFDLWSIPMTKFCNQQASYPIPASEQPVDSNVNIHLASPDGNVRSVAKDKHEVLFYSSSAVSNGFPHSCTEPQPGAQTQNVNPELEASTDCTYCSGRNGSSAFFWNLKDDQMDQPGSST